MQYKIKRHIAREFILLTSTVFFILILFFIAFIWNYYCQAKTDLNRRESIRVHLLKQNIPDKTKEFYNQFKENFYYKIKKRKGIKAIANEKIFYFNEQAKTDEIGDSIDNYFAKKKLLNKPNTGNVIDYRTSKEYSYENIKSSDWTIYMQKDWEIVNNTNQFKDCIFYYVPLDKFRELLRIAHYRNNLFKCYSQNLNYQSYEPRIISELKYISDLNKLNIELNSLEKEKKELPRKISKDKIEYYLTYLFLILFSIIFPLRYLYLSIKWSIKILKN